LPARPCIAKRAVEIAHKEGCGFVAHGATGKGNDQVRFELTFAALDPTLQAIVPWRDPAFYNRFKGRSDLLEYAAARGVPVVQTKAKPYSMDENMMHISYEAGILEDPSSAAPPEMFRMTVDPRKAPDTPALVTVHFHRGLPCRLVNKADGTDLSDPLAIYMYANKIGGAHGVGRVDVVENRFVGIKSRGVYECPGAELLRQAHIGVEGLTMDREVFRLRDTLAARFADLCYNGFWFSPEMEFILHGVTKSQEVRGDGGGGGRSRARRGGGSGACAASQTLSPPPPNRPTQRVTGSADISLYKGKASIVARSSPLSLYNPHIASMDAQGGWNPADSTGFIRINGVRLKAHTRREREIAAGKVVA